jgi:hypothetical protein
VTRFLGGTLRGIVSHVIAALGILSNYNGVAVSRDGSTLLVSDFNGGSHAIHEFGMAGRATSPRRPRDQAAAPGRSPPTAAAVALLPQSAIIAQLDSDVLRCPVDAANQQSQQNHAVFLEHIRTQLEPFGFVRRNYGGLSMGTPVGQTASGRCDGETADGVEGVERRNQCSKARAARPHDTFPV